MSEFLHWDLDCTYRWHCEIITVSFEVQEKGLLSHNLLVIERFPDINVTFKWDSSDRRIQVDDIWRIPLGVEMGVDALHESRLARS